MKSIIERIRQILTVSKPENADDLEDVTRSLAALGICYTNACKFANMTDDAIIEGIRKIIASSYKK